MPWAEIDFRVNWSAYLKEVLKYCLEGNTEVDFQGDKAAPRKWYHAPWLHDDSVDGSVKGKTRGGREFRHGLTRERRTRPKEVHPSQSATRLHQNWAVSLYNDRGGYTIGKVWLTPDGFPDPSRATFPDHTVSFKLLFSAAPIAEVPFLEGAKEWTANIAPDEDAHPPTRVDTVVRLLQIDVAVKDPRVASGSGWIFGTFIYDASQAGPSVWDKMVPVGAIWGDDSHEKRLIDRDGSFSNPYLKQSALNPALIEPAAGTDWGNRAYLRHFGLGGRLNGPVDNPASSCISCHGRAGTLGDNLPLNLDSGYPIPTVAGSEAASNLGKKEVQIAEFDAFFRPIRPGSHFEKFKGPDGKDRQFVTVDYSLQLAQGIRNFYQNLRVSQAPLRKLTRAGVLTESVARDLPERKSLPQVSRGEDEVDQN
ncbi:hypothetical protein [Singulisphaera sp. GP187]|uniref:hypothetical protein n=1 Tax=Singulisphaera sp. GP187 TaxID=1882752 RepID=UPI0011612B6D|nr:hypothetical protein [Singulisphaera sp. GP187]